MACRKIAFICILDQVTRFGFLCLKTNYKRYKSHQGPNIVAWDRRK